nr:olfactory receptor 51F2-like [Pongo pygmaeus]
MGLINSSWFQPHLLLLTGIPGLGSVQIWISIPLCVMYLIAILGNCTILFVIKTTSSLHEPQYIFLSMLATTDLGLSLSTLPTVLNVFLPNHREIEFHSCLTQMFFIHIFSCIESAILLAMAFDWFVAICNPLHYTMILTPAKIIRIGLTAVVRGVMLMVPLPILLKRLPFSHIFNVFIFYVPLIVLTLIHRFGKFTSLLLHVTMANLFLFLTPVLNPLVYSLKTKQIRSAVLKVIKGRGNLLN